MSNNGVSLAGYEKTLRKCHGILHETKPKLSSLDWRKMDLEKFGPEATVVLDPPYPNAMLGAAEARAAEPRWFAADLWGGLVTVESNLVSFETGRRLLMIVGEQLHS